MPIDSSIYSKLRGPDLVGAYEEGLKMKDLARRRQMEEDALTKQRGIDEAYKAGLVENSDGSVGFDKAKTLSALSKIGGKEYFDARSQFSQQDKEQQESDRAAQIHKLEMIGRLAGSATDQRTYEAALAEAPKYGLDVSGFPKAFDAGMIERYRRGALSAKEQLEQQNKDRDFGVTSKKAQSDIEKNNAEIAKIRAETGTKASAGATEGRKAVDKDYAKDFNEWTSVGRAALDKNLERLRAAKVALQNDSSLTGPGAAFIPDKIRNFTNEKAITTRDDVRAAAQGALKATLGSQFTEKEGERIMNQAFNEGLSPKANIAKIDAAIQELETARNNNDSKAEYFRKNGTLSGWERGGQQAVGFVLMRDPSGKIRQIPANQVEAARAAGGQQL